MRGCRLAANFWQPGLHHSIQARLICRPRSSSGSRPRPLPIPTASVPSAAASDLTVSAPTVLAGLSARDVRRAPQQAPRDVWQSEFPRNRLDPAPENVLVPDRPRLAAVGKHPIVVTRLHQPLECQQAFDVGISELKRAIPAGKTALLTQSQLLAGAVCERLLEQNPAIF